MSSLLEHARKVCDDKGLKYTLGRETVLAIVAEQNKALTAYEILDLLKVQQQSAKPTTVYRALEFWMEAGLIHRIDSSNAFVLCEHPGEQHTAQMLICDSCGHVAEVCASNICSELDDQARRQGFRISKQVIESHGVCNACFDK